MTTRYFKEMSQILHREMECKVYGEGGRLCLAFPPQNGRFYDFENFGMVEVLRPWLDSGKMMLVCVDGIDGQTWSYFDGDPRQRIELQEQWFQYVVRELLPWARALGATTGKGIVTGCSMGAFHAGNFFFRRPDKFSAMVSLSGTFNSDLFFGSYMDSVLYDNCPAAFLRNMPLDHPWVKLYRESTIITCCGQGAWEEDLLRGTRELDAILTGMNIPHFSDYWGYDVNHDWPWWRVQLPYFFSNFVLKK